MKLSPRLISHLSYLFVGVASLVLAFYLAMFTVRPSYSGDASTPDSQIQAPANTDPNAQMPPAPPEATEQSNAQTNTQNAAAPVQPSPGYSSPKPNPFSTNYQPPPGNSQKVPNTAPDVSFLEPYVFDVRPGRRNPFKAPSVVDGEALEMVMPGTPLERYELDELKLVGIMWDVRAPKAMFVDPQGEVHTLGKDDRIGRKRGYIAVIREGEVVVVETANFGGENTFSTRVLRIEN